MVWERNFGGGKLQLGERLKRDVLLSFFNLVQEDRGGKLLQVLSSDAKGGEDFTGVPCKLTGALGVAEFGVTVPAVVGGALTIVIETGTNLVVAANRALKLVPAT